MASSTEGNGHTGSRIAELASKDKDASKRSRASRDKDARLSKPFDKPTRLCLSVPKHIVKRLEAHAQAMGQSRDLFAADCLDKHMRAHYSKRDEYLRSAYNSVPDSDPDEPTEETQEK